MRGGAGTSAPVWSPREREVLDLLARGRTNGEIAEALGISFATAKWHVSELISKLGVESREDVAAYWRRQRGFGGHVRGLARGLAGFFTLKVAVGGALGVAAVAGVLLAVLGPGPDASLGGANDPLGGFDHPRTVHLAPDGRLVIADLGTGNNDGRVVAVDLIDGRREVLMSHLPSTKQGSGGLAGPSAAGVNRDGTVCAVISGGDRPGGGFAALHCSNGLSADFRQFEEEHNPDGRGIASNPYDIVADESRGWYVSDSAANVVFQIDQYGAVSVAGVLSRFCCLADQRGAAAPAGMDYLANGRGTIRSLTIALFGGAAATLRAGDPEVGLRMAALPRAIAVMDDGKDAYFLIHDNGAFEPNSGRIVDSLKRDVVTGLDRPTGFARLPDGRFVVAEEARGRVRMVAAPAAVATPTPTPVPTPLPGRAVFTAIAQGTDGCVPSETRGRLLCDYRRYPEIVKLDKGNCDFSDVIFPAGQGGTMPYIDLHGCNLRGAVLRGVAAVEADFSGADLSGADLSGAALFRSDFRGANLTNARADPGVFQEVDFEGANLTGADFARAIVSPVNWRNTTCPDGLSSDSHGGTCIGTPGLENPPTTYDTRGQPPGVCPADGRTQPQGFLCAPALLPALEGKDLGGCDYTGANLAGLALQNADFRGCRLNGANLAGAKLEGASFRGASLAGADLSNTALRGADLSGADLSDVDFRGAYADGVRLADTNLLRATFQGAVLRGFWANTLCPDGSNSDLDDNDGRTCMNNLAR